MTDSQSNIELAVMIVSAYVSHNSVPFGELPTLIGQIHSALAGVASGTAVVLAPQAQLPAVPLKKSITNEFLICLEDGRSFKSLKRHLRTSFGMTPQQYRDKWKLPADYPMVAPAYAKVRSAMAKGIGLGRKRHTPEKTATR